MLLCGVRCQIGLGFWTRQTVAYASSLDRTILASLDLLETTLGGVISRSFHPDQIQRFSHNQGHFPVLFAGAKGFGKL